MIDAGQSSTETREIRSFSEMQLLAQEVAQSLLAGAVGVSSNSGAGVLGVKAGAGAGVGAGVGARGRAWEGTRTGAGAGPGARAGVGWPLRWHSSARAFSSATPFIVKDFNCPSSSTSTLS